MLKQLGILLAVALLLQITYANTEIVIKNLKLFVDGGEFFVKAMCYNPVPLGIQSMDAAFTTGGGLCSVKKTPYGEWKSACHDSDFFDGSPDIQDRWPPGPSEGWFQASWRRDFPVMRELGVNTLRIYNTNPTTRLASRQNPDLIPFPLGKDHLPFMNMADQFGFKVIYPLAGDKTMLLNMPQDQLRQLLMWQIDEVGNHPALLMWNFGNELGLSEEPALLAEVNNFIHFIREYTLQRWNRSIPITSAVVDLPLSYNTLADELNVDVFTTNAGYRGFDFSDLWLGNDKFEGWYKLSCKHQKPLFVGEIGFHSLNNSVTIEFPTWFNSQWRDLLKHIDQGCIGGAFFEYNDEPHSKVDPLQQTMGLVQFTVSEVDGVRSTDANAWNPDTVVRKPIFTYVKQGTIDGEAWNMNTNVWELIGRPPRRLSDPGENICGNFSLVMCPGSTPCSHHGSCDHATGTCTCDAGYGGDDCSTAICPGTPQCSGRGQCVTTLTPPVCACETGWQGASCNQQTTPGNCPSCNPTNGACDQSTGVCRCRQGWTGSDCTIPVVDTNPITPPTYPEEDTTSDFDNAGHGVVPTIFSLLSLVLMALLM